jgi:tetratricopeptide (TPR) repeat protein
MGIHQKGRREKKIIVTTMSKLFTHFALTSIQAGLILLSVGCAARPQDVFFQPTAAETPKQHVSTDLFTNSPATIRSTLAEELRAQPQNGYLHLLNGLSYQMEDQSQQSLALAKVGYDAAVKFTPDHFWSRYLAGAAALDLQNYAEAAEHFCHAILTDPNRPHAFLGLAIAAYLTGDLSVARLAAERAFALTPTNPSVLRTAAYVAAARGERDRLELVLTKAASVPAAAQDLESRKTRLTQLLRTAQLRESIPSTESPIENPSAPPPTTTNKDDLKQMMVEVTLLLNEASTVHNTGINLLDGLTTQFGLDYLRNDQNATLTPRNISTLLTTTLRVPQITYSLNIFNTKTDFYRVLARPSLVTFLGEQSEFFIGRTVTVGVSGINLGTLQPVDVGTSVKITLVELTHDRAKFKIDTNRSFFAQEAGGTFQQSLTTFKQTVGATAEVYFGKTLILSGLYEAVDVGTSSRTPIIGEVPLLNNLFNARTRTQRRDVALVLITPRFPGAIETNASQFRGETLAKLLTMWKELVDPASNMDAIITTLQQRGQTDHLTLSKSGDLRLPAVTEPETVKSVVTETLAQLR